MINKLGACTDYCWHCMDLLVSDSAGAAIPRAMTNTGYAFAQHLSPVIFWDSLRPLTTVIHTGYKQTRTLFLPEIYK